MQHENARVYIAPRSKNVKTGDVPTVWIGVTREESRATCDAVACPLRPWARAGEILCYAWAGTPILGLSSVERKFNAGTLELDLEAQLKKRSPAARIIRIGAIGDPAVMSWGWWYRIDRLAKKYGLKTVSYTHGWRLRPDLAGRTMASCDSLEEAVQARAAGFQAAVATREVGLLDKPITLSDGSRAVICPAMSSKARGKPMTQCNDCALCTGKHLGTTILFPDHGPTSRKKPLKGQG